MKKFLKTILCFALCLMGGFLFASCDNNPNKDGSFTEVESQIKAIYALAVDSGETRTYEQWLASIKGADGADGKGIVSVTKITTSGLEDVYAISYTDGTITPFTVTNGKDGVDGKDGKDSSYATYTVTFDYGVAGEFFDNTPVSIEIKSTQWITNLPTIQEEYDEAFLGWFVVGTDREIRNYDFIGGNVELEARFDDERVFGFSGLYQNGRLVKTWSQIKEEHPSAFFEEPEFNIVEIKRGSGGSYFRDLIGDLIIDDEVSLIKTYAFLNCAGLTSVTILSGGVEDYAFQGCSSLKSIKFGEKANLELPMDPSIPNLGEVFEGCSAIEELIVDENNEGFYSVDNCIINKSTNKLILGCNVSVIPNIVTCIGDYAFAGRVGLTSINIPSSVTNIGSYAFSGCSGLTNITIPETVTNIGQYAFRGCTHLETINYNATNITSLNHVFYGAGIDGMGVTINFGDNLTSIPDYLFQDCTGLTHITIPDSVTSIGNYAFYGCTGLTGITIPDSVVSIGDSAFHGCTGLTSITIPESVISIGQYAFRGCSHLETINYNATNIESLSQVFWGAGMEGLGITVNIGDNVTRIPSGIFSNAIGDSPKIVVVNIGNGVTSIGHLAFLGCSGLTSIIIPSSVTSIGNNAFWHCWGLTSVTIPSSVASIGRLAFAECRSLINVTFGNVNGWEAVNSWETEENAVISSVNLANTEIAATYLTSTYSSYTWERS